MQYLHTVDMLHLTVVGMFATVLIPAPNGPVETPLSAKAIHSNIYRFPTLTQNASSHTHIQRFHSRLDSHLNLTLSFFLILLLIFKNDLVQ
jgi:hypothetical protein